MELHVYNQETYDKAKNVLKKSKEFSIKFGCHTLSPTEIRLQQECLDWEEGKVAVF